jgi:hypothetical protein
MPEQSTTLRDMIQNALDRGDTYRKLAARAIDPITGETASYGLFNNIVLGKTRTAPEPYHLRAIAAALGTTYETVRQAAITQWLPAEEPAASKADERQRAREQAEQAQAIAREAFAAAAEAIARIDREAGNSEAHPQSA